MSGSPHSSLSTPIPPPRAPPSPPDSIASFSTGSLNPNAGDFIPTSFGEHRELDAHVPSSPSSASVQSSPGSSSSTSVSFTLAPSSQSVSSFASITSTPSLSYITPSTTQSSFSSYHSLLDSPNQTPLGFKRTDPFEEADIDSHHSDDAGRPLLRSLRRGSPSTVDIEPGEITTSSATNAATVALPSSPEVVPPGPPKKATYVPLPDIEIHQAAPSTFMNHSTANSARGSTPVTDDGSQDLSDKTPNVYINGLPPNFPEDQLFELAIPFGEVKSVRSFTRHVGEKESGYGFVLFETIESAEKCIHALRRFRNLHPTFSKVHKIPGTSFSQPASTQSLSQNQSSMDDETFKNKMERLHDPTSTNLYLEGLPLSIDEPSLGALMAPHRIKSSRLFQTRLSNPPRIIAFVRLDTRAGAEDVIERLHGRMVRGWNDPGSRISVRFADTAEQRELRRTERSGKEDDPSPSRLTIAQAALLNLHGRDQYRVPPAAASVPRRAAPPPIGVDYGQLRSSYHDLSSNAADAAYQDEIVLPPSHNVLPGQSMSYDRNAMHGSSGPSNPELTPAVVALLNSLRGTNLYAGEDAHYGSLPQHNAPSRTSRSLTHAQLQLLNGSHRNTEIDESGDHYPVIGASTGQARNGFTATEEYILQAHAQTQNQRRRPNRLDMSQAHGQPQLGDPTNLNLGVRGIRTQASNVSVPHRTDSYQSPRMMGGSLPALQEEFQTSRAQGPLRDLYTRNGIPHNGSPDLSERGYGDLPSHNSQTSASNASRTSSQTTNRNNHNTQAHVRSSTLPPHSTPSSDQIHSRHYQHSSMSIPKSRNITSEIMRATSQRVQHRTNNSISSIASGDAAMYSESKYPHDAAHPRHQNGNMKNGEKHAFDSFPNATFPDPDVYDVEQSSPPLVSPALTYSSRGSGATLSPSTPFMGSFSQSQGVSVDGST